MRKRYTRIFAEFIKNKQVEVKAFEICALTFFCEICRMIDYLRKLKNFILELIDFLKKLIDFREKLIDSEACIGYCHKNTAYQPK